MFPRNRELILGVGGGISAYKSAELLRRLQELGFSITVIPTRNSLNFVGKATWEALSGKPVQDDLWNNVHEVPHISLAKSANGIVIAPATADLLARIAQGRAADLLTNVVLAATVPIVMVPAMHPEMWSNVATRANVEVLRARGIHVVEPDEGRMTGEDFGVGRYPEIQKICKVVESALGADLDLAGKRILISAGGTQESIDPVRFIGNRSSGKQGYALAYQAISRGAQVTLVSANAQLPDIQGVTTIHVQRASEMYAEIIPLYPHFDIVIMCAAVADARPTNISSEKFTKAELDLIQLEPTEDILAELGRRKAQQVLIGFAAQTTEGAMAKASEKLRKKNLNMIYLNLVDDGAIFGKDQTKGVIITSAGTIIEVPEEDKLKLADRILDFAKDELG